MNLDWWKWNFGRVRLQPSTNLFQWGQFVLSSGQKSNLKIECDALTDDDWTCIANHLGIYAREFATVVGVPRGGLKLARKMRSHCENPDGYRLVVDDVLTTGGSMINAMDQPGDRGLVLFARGDLPPNVGALFTMNNWRRFP